MKKKEMKRNNLPILGDYNWLWLRKGNQRILLWNSYFSFPYVTQTRIECLLGYRYPSVQLGCFVNIGYCLLTTLPTKLSDIRLILPSLVNWNKNNEYIEFILNNIIIASSIHFPYLPLSNQSIKIKQDAYCICAEKSINKRERKERIKTKEKGRRKIQRKENKLKVEWESYK